MHSENDALVENYIFIANLVVWTLITIQEMSGSITDHSWIFGLASDIALSIYDTIWEVLICKRKLYASSDSTFLQVNKLTYQRLWFNLTIKFLPSYAGNVFGIMVWWNVKRIFLESTDSLIMWILLYNETIVQSRRNEIYLKTGGLANKVCNAKIYIWRKKLEIYNCIIMKTKNFIFKVLFFKIVEKIYDFSSLIWMFIVFIWYSVKVPGKRKKMKENVFSLSFFDILQHK